MAEDIHAAFTSDSNAEAVRNRGHLDRGGLHLPNLNSFLTGLFIKARPAPALETPDDPLAEARDHPLVAWSVPEPSATSFPLPADVDRSARCSRAIALCRW